MSAWRANWWVLTGLVGVLLAMGSGKSAVAFAMEAQEAPPEVQRFQSAISQSRELIKAGKYAEAEASSRELLQQVKTRHGVGSIEAADVLDVLVEALQAGGKAAEAEAMQLAEQAVEIKERFLGPEHPDVAVSLNNVAALLDKRGDHTLAKQRYEQALGIWERAYGRNHPRVAEGLNGLAVSLYALGSYSHAQAHFERALVIRESQLGPDHPDVAGTLSDLASLLYTTGSRIEAKAMFERSLSIREKQLGPDHPDVATTLGNLAVLLQAMGSYSEARPLLERTLAMNERHFGPNHPRVARSLSNMAGFLYATGSYSEAKTLFERALATFETSLGANHPELVINLNNLAAVNQQLGFYSEARSLYERGLLIAEEHLGAEHPDVGLFLSNVADLLQDVGSYAEAKPLLERALKIWEEKFGPDNPILANGLNNFATVLQAMGSYSEAKALFERALSIREEHLGPDHPQVALSLNNLAVLHQVMDSYPQAKVYLDRALDIWQEKLGPDHLYVVQGLNNLAMLHQAMGSYEKAKVLHERALAKLKGMVEPDQRAMSDNLHNLAGVLTEMGEFTEAEAFYREALKIREVRLSPTHPDVASTLIQMALLKLRKVNLDEALLLALRANTVTAEHVATTLGLLPERLTLSFVATNRKARDVLLSIVSASGEEGIPPVVLDDTVTAILRSKGAVLDEMVSRRRTQTTQKNERVRILREGFVAATQRLAWLLVRGPDPQHPASYPELIDEARKEKEKTEEQLARASVGARGSRKQPRVTIRDLSHALPRESALVEIIRYDHYGTSPQHAQLMPSDFEPERRDAAFVVRAGSLKPVWIDLGPAEKNDVLISRWREAIQPSAKWPDVTTIEAEQRYREVSRLLAQKIWRPIEAHVGESNVIFLAPDGPFHLVNFSTLPVEKSNYLIEGGPTIQYLSTARDLLRFEREARKAKKAGPSEEIREPKPSVLLVGAPDYDLDLASLRKGEPLSSAALAFRGGRPNCGDFAAMSWTPLPHSSGEVEQIRQMMEGKLVVETLLGQAAHESAVKAKMGGKRIVHLATHGFFLQGRCGSIWESSETSHREERQQENPLLLSGLVLAGANQRQRALPGEEDGILTAEEVGALDLGGVQWTVLSACETGIGETREGEGVFGLRRALEIAGVQTVILSLWQVPDEATRQWMSQLYLNKLSGQATTDSVRNASLTLLGARRAEGLSTHPFFWGGFVAAGDWR